MSWTDERIATLKNGWENGKSASQIAEELGEGVTRNAVIGKAHRLGLAARPSPVKAGDDEGAATTSPTAVAPVPAAAAHPAHPAAAPVAAKPAAKRSARGPGKPQRTTLLDLNEKVCKWPIGHPGEPDFHFCGKGAQPGFPYCNEHCLIAYQAQLPRRDRDRRPPPIMPGMPRPR